MNRSETEEQIKVRQPLLKLEYGGEKLDGFYENIIAEEVNVKKVVHGDGMKLDKTLSRELRDEGFARELIRFVQAARKKAGLNVDDRIRLSLSEKVPGGFEELVWEEVLATEMTVGRNYAYDEIVEIEDKQITISLEKA
jgi:isoleucyl-tRNA synthetase